MDAVYLFLCLFLCFLSVKSNDLLCGHDACEDVTCAAPAQECNINNATHAGIWLPSPTTCNCCQFCLPLYGEGQHCSVGGPGTGFTVGRCGDGLTCVADDDGHNYCQRMNSTCHNKQDDFDQRQESGTSFGIEMRPHCDGKGKFAPFDCVPAQTCFCQSEEGERIFGEVLNLGTTTTQNMHCGCSRFHAKIAANISPGLSIPVVGPRCTADGNFNPIQCIDRICYCVDRITGQVLEGDGRMLDLDEYPITELVCYDPTLDLFPHQSFGIPPYNYTTPCFEAMQERVDFIEQSKEDGFIVDYFSSVQQCMPDGTFGRIARKATGESICVDDQGNQIQDYEAKPNTAEAENMDCKCAQTSLIMASSPEKPVCCKNGNFRRIQCRRGGCRCVDSNGRQSESENADVMRLSCWTPDWKTC